MTNTQLQALHTLLNTTDFIPELRSYRPSLTEEDWRVAKGWEQCIDFIIQMTDLSETQIKPDATYVEVDKL
jgi:hypothetical protein